MSVYLNGLMLGLSLTMALGPQNIFLIRQGALRQHISLSIATCFLSDALLVSGSIAGLHHVLGLHPKVQLFTTWCGTLFLLYYGLNAILRAFRQSERRHIHEFQKNISRKRIISLALGFSLLNPHAIIDSLILIGGGSSKFPGQQHYFLLGVLSSSLIWFTSLTLIAYFCAHILTREKIWRRVEFFSGLLMLYIGVSLVI